MNTTPRTDPVYSMPKPWDEPNRLLRAAGEALVKFVSETVLKKLESYPQIIEYQKPTKSKWQQRIEQLKQATAPTTFEDMGGSVPGNCKHCGLRIEDHKPTRMFCPRFPGLTENP
jgi:hypothetical protein